MTIDYFEWIKKDRNKALLEVEMEDIFEMFNRSLITRDEFIAASSPVWRALYQTFKKPHEKENGHIYLLEDENGLVRIGMSRNPKKRMHSQIVSGNLKIKRSHISEKIENFKNLETKTRRKFREKVVIADWYKADFDEIKEFINSEVSGESYGK